MADRTAGVADRGHSLPERKTVLGLRGTPEYRAWLAGLTERSLISTSVIVRDALARWAEARGYPPPPRI